MFCRRTSTASMLGFFPDCTSLSKFDYLKIRNQQRKDCSIAVPSRMSTPITAQTPLGGYRIALTDVFDIKGLRKSVGSHAYLELYRPAPTTASSIARIINRGGSILGKTKLGSFLIPEEPAQAVDFQAPWNPRGDGYQSPGGGSSGSAASVSAYDWIDIGIGTDSMQFTIVLRKFIS